MIDPDAFPDDLVTEALAPVSIRAARICALTEHAFEGRITGDCAIGRCQRCGAGALTDGSDE